MADGRALGGGQRAVGRLPISTKYVQRAAGRWTTLRTARPARRHAGVQVRGTSYSRATVRLFACPYRRRARESPGGQWTDSLGLAGFGWVVLGPGAGQDWGTVRDWCFLQGLRLVDPRERAEATPLDNIGGGDEKNSPAGQWKHSPPAPILTDSNREANKRQRADLAQAGGMHRQRTQRGGIPTQIGQDEKAGDLRHSDPNTVPGGGQRPREPGGKPTAAGQKVD
ncbi:hypothetical protein F4780DRAFT_730875 [Xylariomycetidae sp. FL0641]|nr:hypothetical protein F4780DRAFT_730875 [Xylariomycetidae sp. FL0641]